MSDLLPCPSAEQLTRMVRGVMSTQEGHALAETIIAVFAERDALLATRPAAPVEAREEGEKVLLELRAYACDTQRATCEHRPDVNIYKRMLYNTHQQYIDKVTAMLLALPAPVSQGAPAENVEHKCLVCGRWHGNEACECVCGETSARNCPEHGQGAGTDEGKCPHHCVDGVIGENFGPHQNARICPIHGKPTDKEKP